MEPGIHPFMGITTMAFRTMAEKETRFLLAKLLEAQLKKLIGMVLSREVPCALDRGAMASWRTPSRNQG